MTKKQVEKSLAQLLAGRLKTYLEQSGLSVKDFASKANVSAPSIYQILKGTGKTSQMMVSRVEAAIRAESTPPPPQPKLEGDHQGILEVILDEALTKKRLDRLVQYVLRETDEEGADRMRTIAESLLVTHLLHLGGKDLARELLKLHSLISDRTES